MTVIQLIFNSKFRIPFAKMPTNQIAGYRLSSISYLFHLDSVCVIALYRSRACENVTYISLYGFIRKIKDQQQMQLWTFWFFH